ncbi:hypothetical protein SAMN05877753_104435 [Bacillus oleivorans]|uniref:DUF5668 domain-containing protein n=1 Tax=Bacillus oleivorans TaxID=1448271 RepID=A0A285CTT5_9BACI|nr:hypothetical protein [Bacillus oleivorans]SNX70924.1 hypothetical protein SAMN05877753_104435 [Bacillus oleivorans]
MRTWRIGTFSMGASLLFLGVALLVSQFVDFDLTRILVSWWPFIFIVLGIEIFLYLWLQKSGKEMLKYDVLSIFLIGILGMTGLAFTILSQIGVADSIEEMLSREQKTLELPVYDQELHEEVKRVVIENASNTPLTIESTSSANVSIFGTYSGEISVKDGKVDSVDEYLSSTTKGDTLYVRLMEPASQSGPFSTYISMEATVLVPHDLKLEVMGDYAPITLKPRTMVSDWIVKDSDNVSLFLEKDNIVGMEATGIQEVISNIEELQIVEEQDQAEQIKGEYYVDTINEKNVSLEATDASNRIYIMNAAALNVQQTP